MTLLIQQQAVHNIHSEIAPLLRGHDAKDQTAVDLAMPQKHLGCRVFATAFS